MKNFCRPYLLITLLTLVISFNTASAQNFGATLPVDTDVAAIPDEYAEVPEEEDVPDLLTDEEIQDLLVENKIPNSSTVETPSKSGVSAPIENPDISASRYTLGATDMLEINVQRHPEVSGEFIINAEGKMQYEFVGDVEVQGLTKEEVKEILTAKLSKYIISPEVNVKIIGYNSKVVYVVGEVGNPGKIFMRGDTITIREALIMAGLPLLSAKSEKSKLITPADNGKAEQRRVNVHKLLYEGDLRENLVMNPGDTLYVPATLMAKTMRMIAPVAAPISTAAGTGRTVTTGF